MGKKIVIDPITRISGLMSLEVEIDNKKIIDARCTGSMFRGFELMLKGRTPFDAPYFTERICGICSTAHSYVATLAVEKALGYTATENQLIIRELIHGSDLIQSHMRHFYLFVLPDYIDGQFGMPSFKTKLVDSRIPKEKTERIFKHYVTSLSISKKAHQMEAILAGKAPHNHGIYPGGVTVVLSEEKRQSFLSLLREIEDFVKYSMYEDTITLGKYYQDYFYIGSSGDNFLTFGMLNGFKDKNLNYVNSSVILDGNNSEVDFNKICESIKSSWYSLSDNNNEECLKQLGKEQWIDNRQKLGAYSFIKAPRYDGKAMEVGPLARMKSCGLYNVPSSTLGRVTARTFEIIKVVEIMKKLMEKVETDMEFFENLKNVGLGEGFAFRDTMRGTLSHYLNIKDGKIENYNIITPSAWNLGPAVPGESKGIAEKALIGTEIKDENNPIEIGRIIRSFDPCISCATHVYIDKKQRDSFIL